MKKLLLVCAFFVLTGCAGTVPIKMSFPAVPKELTESCADLQQADDSSTKLSDALKVVTANYGQYHECRIKVDTWIEWYTQQKQIFDSIK
jgi:hypothetical protein